MTATQEVGVNPGVFVYLNETAETIRPRIRMDTGYRFSQVNLSDSVHPYAFISEIRQILNFARKHSNANFGTGVDVFCAAPNAPALKSFFGVLDRSAAEFEGEIRVHCFAAPPQGSIKTWLDTFQGFRPPGHIAGGGLYLLAATFRGVTIDRLRSYPVLSQLMRTFALTGKSRFVAEDSFSSRRNNSPFRVYSVALESYVCQQPWELSRFMLNRAIWEHLHPVFSPQVRQDINSSRGKHPTGSFEAKVLKFSATSEGIAEVAEQMMANPDSLESGIGIQRALTNQINSREPQTPNLHTFESCYYPGDDGQLSQELDAGALSIVKEFPVPVQIYLGGKGTLSSVLQRSYSDICGAIRASFLRQFRSWALKSHYAWMPPNNSKLGRVETLVKAFGSDATPENIYSSLHLDPDVTGDEREDRCSGLQNIQFIHLLPLACKEHFC